MPYFLSPIGNSQISDANGDPLVGGTIETYLAGTSTPAATYTSITGGTSQGAVMTLNSLGLPTLGPVWMLGGVALKFIIKNALGAVQAPTYDNVSGVGDTNVTPDQFPFVAGTPTYISGTSFSLSGDQTNDAQLKRRIRSVNSGGTIYSTITNAVFGAGITTVTVANDSGVLDAGLSQVNYSLLTPLNPSVPTTYAKSGANTDITSLSGTKVPTIQVITATGTYTAPAGLRMAIFEAVGGGGGGAGAASGDRGNGGAGGGYSKKLVLAATIGASQAVTIGAGGVAGTAGANAGSAGGTTSVGALLSATGGAGGVIGGAALAALGGIGSSGDVNVRGGSGGNEGTTNNGSGGGSSALGGGAPAVGGSTAAQAGGNYGGGGGGGVGGGATARAGGTGAPGVVIVTEFY